MFSYRQAMINNRVNSGEAPIGDRSGTEQLALSPYRSPVRGFTIVEVVMAVIILSLVIGTTITTIQRSFLSLDSARNINVAGQILQSEIEKTRMHDWSTVSAYGAGPTAMTLDPAFTSQKQIGNRFSVTRTISTVKTDMLKITYTASWNSLDGRPLNRSLTSFYAKDGLYDYFYNSK